MNYEKSSMKDLRKRLESLEISLHYNEAKGYNDNVRDINNEIHRVRQEITKRAKQ